LAGFVICLSFLTQFSTSKVTPTNLGSDFAFSQPPQFAGSNEYRIEVVRSKQTILSRVISDYIANERYGTVSTESSERATSVESDKKSFPVSSEQFLHLYFRRISPSFGEIKRPIMSCMFPLKLSKFVAGKCLSVPESGAIEWTESSIPDSGKYQSVAKRGDLCSVLMSGSSEKITCFGCTNDKSAHLSKLS